MAVESILVCTNGLPIGDAVRHLPFATALRCAFPRAWIAWAGDHRWNAYTDALAPHIHQIIDEALPVGSLNRRRPTDMFGAANTMQHRHFDAILDLQRVGWRTLALAPISRRVMLAPGWGWMFSDLRPSRGKKSASSNTRHIARMHDALIDMLYDWQVAQQDTPYPRISPTDFDPQFNWYDAAEEQAAHAAVPHLGTIGIIPGSREPHRQWSLESYIALASRLLAEGHRIAFLLGPEETTWQERIEAALADACAGATHDHALTFPLAMLPSASIGATVAVASRLRAVVTADCGGMNIAALSGVPMVVLFGATDPAKSAPQTPIFEIIRGTNNEVKNIGVEQAHQALARVLDIHIGV